LPRISENYLGLQPTPLWGRGLWVITRVPKAPTRGYNGGRCEPKAGRRAWGEVRTFEPLFWFRIRGMRNSGSNCKIADGPGSVYRCPGSWPRPRWLVRAVSQLRGGGKMHCSGLQKAEGTSVPYGVNARKLGVQGGMFGLGANFRGAKMGGR